MANPEYTFNAIVIGGGPGGTSAAKTLASAGKKVVLVSTELGGECLNYGCIPTKIYLWTCELLEKITMAAGQGIEVSVARADWQKIKEYRTKIVEKLKKSLKYTLELSGVKIIEGFGKLKDAHTVGVESAQGQQELKAQYIILAAGSESISPQGITPDGIRILNSHQILELKEAPKTLLIIGGGVISVEFASIFSALGAQVTIAEVSDRILRGSDPDVSAEIERVFIRKGIKVLKNTKVTAEQTQNFEKTLIAAGRRPILKHLGLENAGVKTNQRAIETNDFMQTNLENIFAIGDAAGKAMLAYTADREGRIAAQKILGKNPEFINYKAIPYTIFSLPETSSVGLTEPEAQNMKTPYIAAKSLMSANSKALITGNRDGFAKILAEKSSHKILGVHIVGEKASELIAEASLALSLGLTLEQFNKNLHSHPVLSESLAEACEKALEMVK
ncbi:dihydrolipoyl dehydrogenase [Candidatus Peregrinibacteria bacterium]|nr:dihydrolipoyl dehydrogenase [Candidatus Peregrinibacteria bacterium]